MNSPHYGPKGNPQQIKQIESTVICLIRFICCEFTAVTDALITSLLVTDAIITPLLVTDALVRDFLGIGRGRPILTGCSVVGHGRLRP
jgi:hypothetical protein